MRLPAAVIAAGIVALGAAVAEGGRAHSAEGSLDAAARQEAARAAWLFASMSAHLRASDADRRFAERIAADPPVVEEILADVAFVRQAGREEQPRLVDFRVTGFQAVAPDVAELRVREYWVTRSRGLAGESTRSDVTPVRYALRHEGGAWRVADWTLDSGDAGASSGSAP